MNKILADTAFGDAKNAAKQATAQANISKLTNLRKRSQRSQLLPLRTVRSKRSSALSTSLLSNQFFFKEMSALDLFLTVSSVIFAIFLTPTHKPIPASELSKVQRAYEGKSKDATKLPMNKTCCFGSPVIPVVESIYCGFIQAHSVHSLRDQEINAETDDQD